MNRIDLELRVRSITNDVSASIFRKVDVHNYINEGIDRFKQVIAECDGMKYLSADLDEVTHIPSAYHHLLAIYSAARLFFLDEQHYQAGNLMNEFESKLDELKSKILSGQLDVVDPLTGLPVESSGGSVDYVFNDYFKYKAVDM